MKKKNIIIIAVIILTAVLLTAGFFIFENIVNKHRYPLKYEEYVSKYSAEYNVPQEIIYGVIYAESGFNEKAVSKKGAVGLMQVIPSTYEWLAKMKGEAYEDGAMNIPEKNIKYGVYYLSYLYQRFGNWDTAIAGYNAGHNRVSGWLVDSRYSDDGKTLKSIPYSETNNYVKKVNKVKAIYVDLYYNKDNGKFEK